MDVDVAVLRKAYLRQSVKVHPDENHKSTQAVHAFQKSDPSLASVVERIRSSTIQMPHYHVERQRKNDDKINVELQPSKMDKGNEGRGTMLYPFALNRQRSRTRTAATTTTTTPDDPSQIASTTNANNPTHKMSTRGTTTITRNVFCCGNQVVITTTATSKTERQSRQQQTTRERTHEPAENI